MILAPRPVEAEIAIAERAGERDLADIRRRIERRRRRLQRSQSARRPCRPDGRAISLRASRPAASGLRRRSGSTHPSCRRPAPAAAAPRKRASGSFGMILPPPARDRDIRGSRGESNSTLPSSIMSAGNLAERILLAQRIGSASIVSAASTRHLVVEAEHAQRRCATLRPNGEARATQDHHRRRHPF